MKNLFLLTAILTLSDLEDDFESLSQSECVRLVLNTDENLSEKTENDMLEECETLERNQK